MQLAGTVGVLAVLHTWTQRLIFHPHVHCLVTGGGLSDDGAIWHPAGKTFLFPKTALATLARARFRNAFARLCPAADLRPMSGRSPGSFTSRHGARDSRPRSTISPATPSASPSPTTASWPSDRKSVV